MELNLTNPSKEYGYLNVKKSESHLIKIVKFIEKPSVKKAKALIKTKGLWNSGMFFARKDSIINNFKKFEKKILKNCYISINHLKPEQKEK